MKTIAVTFSFFVVAYSIASDVDKKKAEQKTREIERAALFLHEQKKPDVKKQWQRNEQWKDDSKSFNIMAHFLGQEYAYLAESGEGEKWFQKFTDEFGNTKRLDFKKKDGFITEFGIYTLEAPTSNTSFSTLSYNQQKKRYQIKCHENSPEIKVINNAIKYKRKELNVGMSTTNFSQQASSAGTWDPVTTEALEERTICSWFWYPFAWLLYGNGVARWLGYGTKIAKKAIIEKREDPYAMQHSTKDGSKLHRFIQVEYDIKKCLTQQVKDALEKKADVDVDESNGELRYSNLHAAYDAYCYALLSFRHKETKKNERMVTYIFDGFLEAKKSGSWDKWVESLPPEHYDVTLFGYKSRPANVEKEKLACMKVYNAYETLIMAAHTFFEEAQKVVPQASGLYPSIPSVYSSVPNTPNSYSYGWALGKVVECQDQDSKAKFNGILETISSMFNIRVRQTYTNVFEDKNEKKTI